MDNLSAVAVLLDPTLLTNGVDGPAGPPLRFASLRPVPGAATRLWNQTVDYVRNAVLADDALATPLILGHAGRLLAAATLTAFPNNLEPIAADDVAAKPQTLRRALDYIDDNVARDIGLADIAEAVHVTPRTVQYLFRRHLETTPLQYLRQVRLHRAHEDLVAASRTEDTVAGIAARWGFAHTGRFAVQYRQTYGQSPHVTLRG